MSSIVDIPKYKCHKEVWALKISEIIEHENPDKSGNSAAASYGATIVPKESEVGQFVVSAEYMIKHRPKVGGYFVVYEDGYESWSPAEAFESGYSRVQC